ncbi:hypothetical protein ES708_19221 [subsurface metagenome]
MKTIRFVIPALFIILLSYSCEKTNVEPGPKEINLTQKGKILVESDNRFGIKLFKEVLKADRCPVKCRSEGLDEHCQLHLVQTNF